MELRYTFDSQKYYLGKPCVHGHFWPGTSQSLRRLAYNQLGQLNGNNCIGCTGRKQSNWLLSFLDYEAMNWPANETLGKLCDKGHKWKGIDAHLRRWGKCVECEKLRKRKQLEQRRITDRRWHPELRGLPTAERRRLYKRMVREKLREQGLTARGTAPARADGGVLKGERNEALALEAALRKAIQGAGHCPSVARLVMEAQRQYWRKHPKAKREHDKQWDRASWWLEYQTNPSKRLYVREKARRRKALIRNVTARKIKARELRARYAQFDNCCAYCGAAGDMQIEHVIPISKGGTHAIGNIVPACKPCNDSKRDHEAERWYRSQPQFCEKRWRKICRVIGWDRSSVGQLALL